MAEEHDHVYRLTPEFGDFKRQLGGLKSAMGASLKVAGGLSAAILGAGAAFKGLADDVFGVVDQMNTLSKASGLSIDTVNGLRAAAAAANKDVKDLVPKNLAKNMVAAADGSKTMENAFKRLGVSVTDETGALRDADAVFRESIDALTRHENATEAAALASQLMGKQGRELLSAFSGSSDLDHFVDVSKQFGIQVGPDAIDASNAWWAATSNLTLAFDSAKSALAVNLGPAAAKFVNDFSLGFVFLQQFTTSFFDLLGDNMERAAGGFKKLISGDLSGFADVFRDPREQLDLLDHAYDIAEAKARSFWRANLQDAGSTAEATRQATVATTRYEGAVRDALSADKERMKVEADAAKARDLAFKEHQKRIQEEIEAQGKWEESVTELAATIDETLRKFDQDRRDWIHEGWVSVKDTMLSGAAELGAVIVDGATASAEALMELRAQAVKNRKMTDENNEVEMKAAQQKIDDIDSLLKKRRTAAQMGFFLERAAALAEIVQATAVATMTMIPAFAFLGPGAIPAAIAAVAPLALAQTANVLMQKPPSFHDGGEIKRAPDEFMFGGNLARFGEKLMVANQRQAELIDQQNRTGMMERGGTRLVMADAGRAMATMLLQDIRSPGSEIASAFGATTGQVSVWSR